MSEKINQILWSPDFAPSSMMILLLKRLSSISSLDTFIFLAMSILSIFFSHCFDGLRLFFLDCPLLQATIVKKDNRTSIKRNLHHCHPFLDFIYLFFLSSLHLIRKILKSAADFFLARRILCIMIFIWFGVTKNFIVSPLLQVPLFLLYGKGRRQI